MVRGEGTVQCAINGETGFAYGKATKLNSEWQKISVSYFTNYSNFVYHIYSQVANPSTYEVKDITVTVVTPPELTAADIPGKLFLPADYPGENGKPLESLRAVTLREAMQDLRVLRLAEAKLGRDAVLAVLENSWDGGVMTMTSYPTDPDWFARVRETLAAAMA
jgi:hypothetical protein